MQLFFTIVQVNSLLLFTIYDTITYIVKIFGHVLTKIGSYLFGHVNEPSKFSDTVGIWIANIWIRETSE